MMVHATTGARKPGLRGERAISRKPIAQGMPDDLAEPVVTAACLLFCRRAMGEAFTRHSLRPLSIQRATLMQASGAMRRENTDVCLGKALVTFSAVIARLDRAIQCAAASQFKHG